MHAFTEWDGFYVIIGSAAGALIGLQFVVMTLIAEKPPKDFARAGAALVTPTIVHFGAVLFVSALMGVPWPAILFPAVVWVITGAAGLVYTGIVGRRMKNQNAYQPAFEDWLFHVVLPLASYALLGLGSFAANSQVVVALFAVATSALLLLFIGIHNAWDAVAYHVFVNVDGPQIERQKNHAKTGKK